MCDGGRFAVPTTLIRPAGLLKNASIFARCSAGHDIHLRLDTDSPSVSYACRPKIGCIQRHRC